MSENASIAAGFVAYSQFNGIGLQNRCTTTVLSRPERGFPRESLLCGQREKRGRRVGQRFTAAQGMAQYAPALFRNKSGRKWDCHPTPALTTNAIGARHG